MKPNYIIKALVAVSIAVFFTFNANAQEAVADSTTYVKVGQKAPDFTVEMLDGSTITLSQLRGKVVLLNFWATWCSPCMMEFKELTPKIIKPFEGKDFVLLPISREEKRATVEKKMESLKKQGINFPVGIDPTRAIYSQYAKQTIPRLFLIDKEGRIAYIFVGYAEDGLDNMAKEIKKLL